jgi:hypothetical protein
VLVASEEQQIDVTFGQLGGPYYNQTSWGNTYERRTFKDGDIVNLLIESSVAGGYWYDLRRFLCIGRVPKEVQEAFEIVKESWAIMAAN